MEPQRLRLFFWEDCRCEVGDVIVMPIRIPPSWDSLPLPFLPAFFDDADCQVLVLETLIVSFARQDDGRTFKDNPSRAFASYTSTCFRSVFVFRTLAAFLLRIFCAGLTVRARREPSRGPASSTWRPFLSSVLLLVIFAAALRAAGFKGDGFRGVWLWRLSL